jgi:broad specificity phosphatase PhoE
MQHHDQRVTVVRHGETEWSASGRHTGRTDIALTDRGRESARRTGRWLATSTYQRVWTSPLRRAADTCAIAGYGDDAEVHEPLMEWDYGAYEGLTRDQIVDDTPDWMVWTHGAPDGESVADVQARVDATIARLLDLPGDTLLFAHGHLLRALAAAWMELPITEGRRLLLDTAAVGTLGWYHGRRALARWNVLPT